MYCGKRGRRRKDGLNRRGKAGDCGEDGAGRKCGCRGRRRRGLYIGILVCVILLHIAAWGSREFCDWYQRHVFGIWVDTYGRLVGMAPFSVGEILIGFAVAFGAVGAVLGAVWLIGRAAAQRGRGQRRDGNLEEALERNGNPEEALERNGIGILDEMQGKQQAKNRVLGEALGKENAGFGTLDAGQRKGQGCRSRLSRVCRAYCRAGLWMLLWAFVLMTLNCYILYHGSGFSGTYLMGEDREYAFEELAALRNFVAEQCNALCCQIPREEDGSLRYEGDMLEAAKAAMRHLGESYDGLGGFYPTPKPLLSSDFMSQQHIAGCYYPFSMEANYNDVMYVMNLPSTLCHELGHLKGYIREDEANLIGYLACVQSEDIFFQYSGYLSVLYYVDKDYRQAIESGAGPGSDASWQSEGVQRSENVQESEFLDEREVQEHPATVRQTEALQRDEALQREVARTQPETRNREWAQAQILPQVHADNIFLTSQERARIEKGALLNTEAVDAISDSIADTSLKLNGVQDGMISYSRVVELLLRYYDIYGYP